MSYKYREASKRTHPTKYFFGSLNAFYTKFTFVVWADRYNSFPWMSVPPHQLKIMFLSLSYQLSAHIFNSFSHETVLKVLFHLFFPQFKVEGEAEQTNLSNHKVVGSISNYSFLHVQVSLSKIVYKRGTYPLWNHPLGFCIY